MESFRSRMTKQSFESSRDVNEEQGERGSHASRSSETTTANRRCAFIQPGYECGQQRSPTTDPLPIPVHPDPCGCLQRSRKL